MRTKDYPMGSLPVPAFVAPANPLIIERPELQSGGQRAVFGVLTGMFWLLWVVLWLPLITLLGWAFFGYQFHFRMIALHGYVGFLDVLWLYALTIAVMGGGLMLWAKYNHLRFRGVERRKGFAPPTPADLALVHGQHAADIAQWQAQSIVTVHHTADGRILRVDL